MGTVELRLVKDRLGRDVILLPDEVREPLTAWKNRTWREVYGMATGDTATALPGSREHVLLDRIWRFACASGIGPPPERPWKTWIGIDAPVFLTGRLTNGLPDSTVGLPPLFLRNDGSGYFLQG